MRRDILRLEEEEEYSYNFLQINGGKNFGNPIESCLLEALRILKGSLSWERRFKKGGLKK